MSISKFPRISLVDKAVVEEGGGDRDPIVMTESSTNRPPIWWVYSRPYCSIFINKILLFVELILLILS